LKREDKIRVVEELRSKFERAKGIVFTDYRGLNVAEMNSLRNTLREASLEYRVVKNTLARRAADGTQMEIAKDFFSGPIGIAVGYDDPVMLVKKVLDFSKENDKFEIKAGLIEGTLCTSEQLKTISQLPPREVQLAMLASAMKSPITKLAYALHATVSRFVYALEALKRKKESEQ